MLTLTAKEISVGIETPLQRQVLRTRMGVMDLHDAQDALSPSLLGPVTDPRAAVANRPESQNEKGMAARKGINDESPSAKAPLYLAAIAGNEYWR